MIPSGDIIMKTKLSRRAALAGGLALAPAAAAAALPANGSVGDPFDPIFAAIARHQAAEAAYSIVAKDNDQLEHLIPDDKQRGGLWCHELSLDPNDDPRWTAHLIALQRVGCELEEPKAELLDTVPTTMAGVIALVRYARERDACGDGCLAVGLYGNIADALEALTEVAA
jgi:hypothetical protein